MGIRASAATIGACERIIETLRAELPAALAAVGEAGLYLPAPAPQAYYLTSDQVADLLQQEPVVVIVEQLRAARYDDEDQLSGDGQDRQIWRILPVRVRLMFADTDGFEPLERAALGGREQTRGEWMLHRARRYGGAMIEALYRHAQDDHNIERIQLRSDDVAQLPPAPDGRARMGGAVQDWDCWQAMIAPMAQY